MRREEQILSSISVRTKEDANFARREKEVYRGRQSPLFFYHRSAVSPDWRELHLCLCHPRQVEWGKKKKKRRKKKKKKEKKKNNQYQARQLPQITQARVIVNRSVTFVDILAVI